MFFTCGLNNRWKVDQLMAFLTVHEICQTLSPSILEFNQDLNKFYIIFKLRIHYLNILFVLLKKRPEVSKCFLYSLSKCTNCFWLMGTNTSKDSFSGHEDIVGKIVPTHTFRIGNWIYFTKDLDELRSFVIVLRSIHHDSSPRFLPLLNGRKIFFCINSLRNKSSGVSLNEHEFQNVYLLVSDPRVVEVLKVLAHLIEHVLYCNVHLFHDPLVDVPNDLLNDLELLEKFAASLQDILRENVFFAIHPQVRESFLSRVQYLGQVAQGALLIKNLIGFGELLSVFPCCTDGLEAFAESFNLV